MGSQALRGGWRVAVAGLLLAAAAGAAEPRLRPWTRGETPALAGTDLGGRPIGLEAFRGCVVLVAFWASWCEPCADELAAIAKLRARLEGRPFAVLAVNLGEGPERVEQFLRAHAVELPVLLDRDRRAGAAWGVGGLPMAFLVGADGRVRSWAFGENDWRGGELVDELERLLREAERSRTPPAVPDAAASAAGDGAR